MEGRVRGKEKKKKPGELGQRGIRSEDKRKVRKGRTSGKED